jgi:hypothetical protein
MNINKTLTKFATKLKDPRSAVQTVTLVCVTALAYLYRAHPYFFKPQLFAEDGTLWLAEGRMKGAKVLILKPYNGFFHAPDRIFGFLVAHLPLYWAPAIFAITAWLLFIGVAYYLLSKRTHIFTNNYERIFIVICLCLISNFDEFFFNFSNSIFLIGVIGAMIMVADKPKHKLAEIGEKTVYVLACFCLPFAWFYIPVALFDRYKYKAKNNFFLVVALVSSIAQAMGYFLTHPTRSPVTLTSVFFNKYVPLVFYNQIIIPAIRFARLDIPLGDYATMHYWPAVALLSIATLAIATIAVLRRSNKQTWFTLFFLAGMTFASFKSPTIHLDTATEVFKSMANLQGANRYFVFGILAVNIIFVKAVYQAFTPKARYLFMVIFVSLGLLTSIHYHSFFIDKHWQDYTAQYHQGIKSYYEGKKTNIIPVNPAPWTMGLFNL